MKNILFFGDSNTWGSIASSVATEEPSKRYDVQTRYTCVAEKALGEGYACIEEGLCGRTTIYTNPDEAYKNGETYLLPCLLSHRPLDLVVMMLGTNDLRLRFTPTVEHLGDGIRRMIEIVKTCPTAGAGGVPPKVLIVSPIHIQKPNGRTDYYNDRGGEAGEALAAHFATVYSKVADETGCAFLDAALYATADKADGLHMDGASHIALGKAVADAIRQMSL